MKSRTKCYENGNVALAKTNQMSIERMEIVLNDELKLKWHSIYDQILFDRKLTAAWKQVKENKGCGGIDMETIETFGADEEKKILQILQELRRKEYKPTAVKRVYIPKKNGDKRPLGIPVIKDRIVRRAL